MSAVRKENQLAQRGTILTIFSGCLRFSTAGLAQPLQKIRPNGGAFIENRREHFRSVFDPSGPYTWQTIFDLAAPQARQPMLADDANDGVDLLRRSIRVTMLSFVSGLALPRARSRRENKSNIFACAPRQRYNRSRRALLRDALLAAAAFGVHPFAALAAVDFDIDRFGDKELKVSTINKVKQNCRNVLNDRPDLLPSFFLLSVHDALTYDQETNEGGPNGSLRFELESDGNAELRDAFEAIKEIRALQREDMSYADTFAFAGAVAVEVTGGPRIVVQLGREDAKKQDPPGLSELYRPGATAQELMNCFAAPGLQPARDVVLVHGAVGSLNDIAQSRAEKMRAADVDDGDNEDEESLEDVTYGKVTSKKRGPVLVSSNVSLLTLGGKKFSNGYLAAMLKAKDVNSLTQRDRVILENDEMRAQVQRYAGNNAKFLNDMADLFQRMTLLGSSYESLKLEDK